MINSCLFSADVKARGDAKSIGSATVADEPQAWQLLHKQNYGIITKSIMRGAGSFRTNQKIVSRFDLKYQPAWQPCMNLQPQG